MFPAEVGGGESSAPKIQDGRIVQANVPGGFGPGTPNYLSTADYPPMREKDRKANQLVLIERMEKKYEREVNLGVPIDPSLRPAKTLLALLLEMRETGRFEAVPLSKCAPHNTFAERELLKNFNVEEPEKFELTRGTSGTEVELAAKTKDTVRVNHDQLIPFLRVLGKAMIILEMVTEQVWNMYLQHLLNLTREHPGDSYGVMRADTLMRQDMASELSAEALESVVNDRSHDVCAQVIKYLREACISKERMWYKLMVTDRAGYNEKRIHDIARQEAASMLAQHRGPTHQRSSTPPRNKRPQDESATPPGKHARNPNSQEKPSTHRMKFFRKDAGGKSTRVCLAYNAPEGCTQAEGACKFLHVCSFEKCADGVLHPCSAAHAKVWTDFKASPPPQQKPPPREG